MRLAYWCSKSTCRVTYKAMPLIVKPVLDDCPCAGLLAGVAARAQRREYMQLLADCQRGYCEVRLLLVADVVGARMAEYSREPLPSLTRSGCSYLMQARAAPPSIPAPGQPLSQSACLHPVLYIL